MIVQVFLSQFVPEVLHRIEFRAVRRLDNEADVFGDFKVPSSVPSRTVDQHDNEVIGEFFRYFF